MKKIIRIVKADDWQALYLDDYLMTQGHKIDCEDIVYLINGTQEYEGELVEFKYEEYWCDAEWIEDVGEFPKHFTEVKLEGV